MAYRRLSADERVAYIAANAPVVEWAASRDLTRSLFGPAATTAEAVIGWQYVDEAGSLYQRPHGISAMRAFDADGVALQPDFSLPFWQANANYFAPDRPMADQADIIHDVMFDACKSLDEHLMQGLSNLNAPTKRYDLARPPLSETVLFALEP